MMILWFVDAFCFIRLTHARLNSLGDNAPQSHTSFFFLLDHRIRKNILITLIFLIQPCIRIYVLSHPFNLWLRKKICTRSQVSFESLFILVWKFVITFWLTESILYSLLSPFIRCWHEVEVYCFASSPWLLFCIEPRKMRRGWDKQIVRRKGRKGKEKSKANGTMRR